MDNKSLLKFFITRGSVIYTLLSTSMIVVSILLAEDSSVKILVPKQYLFLLLFSFIMSLGSSFLKMQSLSRTLARVCHAVCFIGGFLLFLTLCGVKFVPVVISGAVFALVYTVAVLISVHTDNKSGSKQKTVKNTFGKKKKKVEYTPMFRSNSQKDDRK